MVYQAALTLHITGIVLFAGATFMDFIISKQFWNAYSTNKNGTLTIETTITKIQKIAEFGGRFILLSGIIMIYINPLWSKQTWFQVKMGVLLIVLINGATFRRKLGKSLNLLASGDNSNTDAGKLKSNLNRTQLIQIILLTIMFTLSVFKFN